ncbi:MAG: hypothetical protein AB7V46_12085 [Thermomicrobiales bacterium]
MRGTILPPFFFKPQAPDLRRQEEDSTAIGPLPEARGAKPWPRFITTQQLVADTLQLASTLPPEISAIIGVARSGMLPASVLATSLHLPLFALDQERGIVRSVGHGWRFRQYEARKGPVLVIDDTTGSGRSLRMTRQALVRCQSCRTSENEKILASVYCNPDSPLKPDLWSVDLHLPHLLEWNFMNSIVTSVAAFDFDGILCHDAESGGEPGTPLYLPRREPVHIITGRRERHRAVTLAWLKKWHVSVASLTMMANDDQREIAEYKAEAVKLFAATAHERPFGEAMYVESCPKQARRIAELSGVMVVCPLTREVLQVEGCCL